MSSALASDQLNLRGPSVPARTQSRLPLYFAVLLGYLLFLPPQTSLSIGGSVIPPYRFLLLASALFVLFAALRGRFRWVWPDLLILAAVAWISLAMSMTSDAQQALTASVAHIADIGLAYFFARAAFNDTRDLRMFLLLMLPGLFLTGVILLVEAVTYQHIIQGFFSSITGRGIDYQSSPRMGLMRAQAQFAHPIQAGIFLASFLPLYWFAGFKPWLKITGVLAALLSFATVSSVTFLALAFGLFLVFYQWLTEKIANLTWRLLFIGVGLFIFAAELGTGSGTFGLLTRFGSLNSVSAYARINIWNYGSANVVEHPWFGLGYADWERPVWMVASVDNYWLLTAMRFGIPAVVFLGLAALVALVMIMRRSTTSSSLEAQSERGVAISVAIFTLSIISASIWLQSQVWYFMLIGIAVSLASAPRQVLRAARRTPLPNPVAFPGSNPARPARAHLS